MPRSKTRMEGGQANWATGRIFAITSLKESAGRILLTAKSQDFCGDRDDEQKDLFLVVRRRKGRHRKHTVFKAPFVRRVGIVGEGVLEIGGRAPQEKLVGIARQIQEPRVGRRQLATPPEPSPGGNGQPVDGSNHPPPGL